MVETRACIISRCVLAGEDRRSMAGGASISIGRRRVAALTAANIAQQRYQNLQT